MLRDFGLTLVIVVAVLALVVGYLNVP